MLSLVMTSKFRKDLDRMCKRGKDLGKMKYVIDMLCAEKDLAAKYRVHALIGNYKGFYECHVEPDWILIYAIDKEALILVAAHTGTHSDLFR